MWLNVVDESGKHKCEMPRLAPEQYTKFAAGSSWRCVKCGTVYVITGWTTPLGWAELSPDWERLR